MKVAEKFELTANTATTQEFRCPQCGTTTTHRNWDADKSKMNYQCSGCGQIYALDYKEVYYLRTKKPGAYTHAANGEIIFMGYDKYNETPAVPADPGKAIYERVPDADKLISGGVSKATASTFTAKTTKVDDSSDDESSDT